MNIAAISILTILLVIAVTDSAFKQSRSEKKELKHLTAKLETAKYHIDKLIGIIKKQARELRDTGKNSFASDVDHECLVLKEDQGGND